MQFLHQDFEIKHKNTFYSPLVEPNVLYVEIYPLYICNYKCFFCYIKNNYKNKKHPMMTRKNINDVLDSIDDLSYRLNKSIDLLITNNKDKLIQLSNNKYFKEPSLLVDKISLLLDYKIERLKLFYNKLDNYKLQIDKEVDRMGLLLDIKLNKKRNELDRLNGLLKAYSCENTLKRGYALVYKDNKLINKDIDNDDKLVIETYDQIIDTRVEKVSKKNG